MKRFIQTGAAASAALAFFPTGISVASDVTAASASQSSPSSSSACQSALSTFVQQGTSGTYTSNADTISFSGLSALNNPSAPGSSGPSQTLSVTVTAYDSSNVPVSPSSSSPMTIAVYGAAGTISVSTTGLSTSTTSTTAANTATLSSPVVLTLSAGNQFSLAYNGGYLGRPPTITATMPLGTQNACTGTDSYAIGSTTLPLVNAPTQMGTLTYSTPTACQSGASGTTCSSQNVNTNGLQLPAAVGYEDRLPGLTPLNSPSTAVPWSTFTLDTGSIGTVVPLSSLGPDAIGPGQPAMEYYDSSGYAYMGFVYLAPVTFKMGSIQVTSDPIRVIALMADECYPNSCTPVPSYSGLFYMGVGFNRNQNGATSGNPLASPHDNALLSIDPSSGGTFSQGYVLSGSTITAGITSQDTSGAKILPLQANSQVPGDWLMPTAGIRFPTAKHPKPKWTCAAMLMDIGIKYMILKFPSASSEPPEISNGLKASQKISIIAPCTGKTVFAYHFSSGPQGEQSPPARGMAPGSVSLRIVPTPTGVFVNTGRHVLFEYQYVYDAQLGQIGFIPLKPPLR